MSEAEAVLVLLLDAVLFCSGASEIALTEGIGVPQAEVSKRNNARLKRRK